MDSKPSIFHGRDGSLPGEARAESEPLHPDLERITLRPSQQARHMSETAAHIPPPVRRSRGGAEARRAARSGGPVRQQAFIRRNVALYEPFSNEQLELIEHNAELVLE